MIKIINIYEKYIYIIKYKLHILKKYLMSLLTIQSVKQMRYRYISKNCAALILLHFFMYIFSPTVLHNIIYVFLYRNISA